MCVAPLRLFPGNAMRMLGTNAVRSTRNARRLPSIHIAPGSQELGWTVPPFTELLESNSLGLTVRPIPVLHPCPQLDLLLIHEPIKPEAKKPKKVLWEVVPSSFAYKRKEKRKRKARNVRRDEDPNTHTLEKPRLTVGVMIPGIPPQREQPRQRR